MSKCRELSPHSDVCFTHMQPYSLCQIEQRQEEEERAEVERLMDLDTQEAMRLAYGHALGLTDREITIMCQEQGITPEESVGFYTPEADEAA